MRSPVADLLADLSRAFDALSIPWYLFDAQAAIIYGVARLTADVDVTARAAAGTNATAWLPALEVHGFQPRFSDPAFVAQTRVLPVVHQTSGLPVDIVLAGPGLEDEFLARAVRQTIDGVSVPIIEVSDLVALKVLAGRPKDLDDVTMLLRIQQQRVDNARVREVLGLLESALGQSDLLPIFESLVRRG